MVRRAATFGLLNKAKSFLFEKSALAGLQRSIDPLTDLQNQKNQAESYLSPYQALDMKSYYLFSRLDQEFIRGIQLFTLRWLVASFFMNESIGIPKRLRGRDI